MTNILNVLKKKKLRLPLLLFFLTVLLAGAYFWQRRTIVIRLGIYSGSSWDVPNSKDNRVIDSAIAVFEAEHPNVKVVYDSGIPKDDYSSWLSDSILRGKQPDLFMVPEDDFSLLSSAGALRNLSSLIENDLDTGAYYSSSLTAGQYKGEYYALPFEANPIMMCVNKDLLEKEGLSLPDKDWTLADFYRICQAVTKDTDGDGVVDQYGSTDYTWQQALLAYGGEIYDQNTNQLTVASGKMRKALSFISKLEALTDNIKVSSEDFDQGKVAFYPMTLAQYRTYKPYPYHVAKYSSFSWTCIQMPAEEKNDNATEIQTSLFAMSAKTRHSDLVWDFLKILSSRSEIQQELVDKSQGMSVLQPVMTSEKTQDALNSDELGTNSLSISTLNQMMSDSKIPPRFKHYDDVMLKLDHLIEQALAAKTIDSELWTIQRAVEEELDD
ncbi:extracellular solute-binding protein [Streptococcus chenjunshii]|uniref:Extracellular solute-binding protein n=1 Tax=Streptococcus chenjunshii TaxID=2173853 RepID=A0A372KN23_9STRE|nr:extracellular solute-binding protein [Streptococcus chenjunshii]AXQ77726.1 extracellular solute-binding protein [Streptococcus chenjunshii]RFU50832.1 extracellular solute-binding protein [Streptococcus chenjunshii]RFU52978.1 extracellular solute-binding protein [Streptococcus chenjunshii]